MELPYFIEPSVEGEEEPEIRILGKRFFCKDYAVFNMTQIKDQALLDLYKVMEASLNNAHNSKKNIYVVLLLKEDETVELAFIHSHLEDADIWNVTAMSRILVELEDIMNKRPTIELWDNYWEKLLISVGNIPYKFTKNAEEIKNLWISYCNDDEPDEEELDEIIKKYGGRY